MTIPPELIFWPLLPFTLLFMTLVWVAPNSRMPPPCVVTGVSSFAGQSLLLRKTLLP